GSLAGLLNVISPLMRKHTISILFLNGIFDRNKEDGSIYAQPSPRAHMIPQSVFSLDQAFHESSYRDFPDISNLRGKSASSPPEGIASKLKISDQHSRPE
ncbi:13058_t:CDS:2, partial [Acaulospora colombiana]